MTKIVNINLNPSVQPEIKTYHDGGMTLMKWGKGDLLFRHARLGFGNTCGHGHADALSILFSWQNVPVLIDLGSGQYNGDQAIRNFFRSTIAHNTVEIGGKNQAKMLGPFMWEQSYETMLKEAGKTPILICRSKPQRVYERVFSASYPENRMAFVSSNRDSGFFLWGRRRTVKRSVSYRKMQKC